MNLIVALAVLSLLMLVHELGHFLVAKACRMPVLEFSLFMGPKLLAFRKGGTQYTLRLIPMGAYVKLEGEEATSDNPLAFNRQKIWKRALVMAAGSTMNILLAFVLMSSYTMAAGVLTNRVEAFGANSPLQQAGMQAGDRLVSWNGRAIHDMNTDMTLFLYGATGDPIGVVWENAQGRRISASITLPRTTPTYRLGFSVVLEGEIASNVVDIVEQDSPIQKAGLRHGDRIVRIDGQEVASRDEIVAYLNNGRGEGNPPVTLTVHRNGASLIFRDVVPFMDSQFYLDTGFVVDKPSFFGSLAAAGRYAVSSIRMVLTTLGWLFTGQLSFSNMSGPVGIVGTIGTVVEREVALSEKLLNLASLGALLSLNLGVMNLIPFPALDGSKLVLLLIEKIRRKPLPPEKEGLISLIGFALLILVLIGTLFNDIPRWIL